MLESFGYFIVRIFGYGWLWKRNEHKESKDLKIQHFGNGGYLLEVGLFSSIVLIGICVLLDHV